jgi:hypothetical protein
MIVVMPIAMLRMPGVRCRFQTRTLGYWRCGGNERSPKIGCDDQQSENPFHQRARHRTRLLPGSQVDQARLSVPLRKCGYPAGSGTSAGKSEFTLRKSVFQPDPSQHPSCGSQPGAAERQEEREMRKSLLTLIVVGALASGAAPGFAAADTQQQAPAMEQPHCTAVSAKDVALDENKCE